MLVPLSLQSGTLQASSLPTDLLVHFQDAFLVPSWRWDQQRGEYSVANSVVWRILIVSRETRFLRRRQVKCPDEPNFRGTGF